MKKSKLLSLTFGLLLFSFSIYSYSQIDLNLTLSSWLPYQDFQKKLINLGYFNRPLSTAIFLFLIFFTFSLYFFLLKQIQKKIFNFQNIKILILLTVLLLIFSYPAFSHDIFNYIFDARIVLKYHQNPYQTRPLDYQFDPWTRFMHWTHRPSVFPPGWIFLTLLPLFFGFGKFVLTLLNFKIFIAAFYLLSIIAFQKILKETKDKLPLLKLALFALNPLIIVESLINAHMDIVMVFFALLGFYMMLKKRYWLSLLLIVVSGSIKYITLYLLPVLLIVIFFKKIKKEISQAMIINYAAIFSVAVFILFILNYGLNPWYFLWIFPFLILKLEKPRNLFILSLFTLFLILHYAPFLYFGFWTRPTSTIRTYLTISGALLFIIPFIFSKLKSKLCLK